MASIMLITVINIILMLSHVVKSFKSVKPVCQRSIQRLRNSVSEEDSLDAPDTLPKSFKSTFLQTLLERGYIHQCTDFKGLDEKFCAGIVPAYLGNSSSSV